jgi:hypothetical protein
MKMPDGGVIRGWEEIAKCLHVGVRTAQRYARTRHLPVWRAQGAGPRAPVFALKSELDQWRFDSRASLAPPHVASPHIADLALPALQRIFAMEEATKLYRRNYVMRFDLRSSRTGIRAQVEYTYELCNASNEKQAFVQEVTVDNSDHGEVESLSFLTDNRTVYHLKKPPVSESYIGWLTHRGPLQWIEPTSAGRKYICRASWVINRAPDDIWYNHMILPTVGCTIETRASSGFEITPSFSEAGLLMKGEHRDIAWRRRTEP